MEEGFAELAALLAEVDGAPEGAAVSLAAGAALAVTAALAELAAPEAAGCELDAG